MTSRCRANSLTALSGLDAMTVQAAGWSSFKNGELLRRAAAAGFEVFLTPDRNLEYQQNLSHAGLGIVVLLARTNRMEDLLPLIPRLREVLPAVRSGTVVHVS